MTKHLWWGVVMALGALPSVAQAQSDPMQHAAPTETQAAQSANETEVVWLRRRVEQLEMQLAAGAGARSPDAKSKMKSKKDSSMPAGSMRDDDKMGSGAMGSMPMNEHSMGKMKRKKEMGMKPMGDDKMGGGHM